MMRIPGKKLAYRSFRWTRSRLLGGIVVLGYHRLRHDDQDPFRIEVSADDFEAHLRVVARVARVIGLGEAVLALSRRRLPPRSVVITFDDGYADTVHEVLPLLERHEMPATVFVTPGSPGRPFWWDQLAAMILDAPSLPPRLDLEIRGQRRTWVVASTAERQAVATERRALLFSLEGALRTLGSSERDAVLDEIRHWCGRDGTVVPRHRSLTTDEIRRLAASPLIDIGAHTLTHPVLTSLSDDEQQSEIVQSRVALEAITGQPVRSFSYPHGSYGASTVSCVRAAGFTAACCSTPDVMTPHADAFALPRLWVQPRDGRQFGRWLERWLVG